MIKELVVTAKIKILPTIEQKQQLIETMNSIRNGLNFASNIAYENNKLSSMKKLQNLVYKELRESYNLKSQMACNICSVVSGTYASMKSNNEDTLAIYKKPKLQYSYNRDYSFLQDGTISIGTINKRIKLNYITKGLDHYFDGSYEFGTATLVYKKRKFYLHISCKKEIEVSESITNVVGVDLGMRFLATAIDSKDNHLFINGSYILRRKAKFLKQRKDLQSLGTKSAKRKLKTISGKENRYQTDVNHCVSKALVDFAKDNSLIVLEDLTRININTKVYHKYRYYRMNWAFYQLRQFIEYKGFAKGIQVIDVAPAFSSQKCPKCGFTHKDNRNKKTHSFTCLSCHYKSNDDRIGSMNLRQMGIEYHAKLTQAN
ncbi:MAG: RNA-guided endonuclease TnpB family protein [Sarcina sp.]